VAGVAEACWLIPCDYVDSQQATVDYRSSQSTFLEFARHLTAEAKAEEFAADKGLVTKWERLRRNNHWLDALYNACAAGHLVRCAAAGR
jgi:hypothetical protein